MYLTIRWQSWHEPTPPWNQACYSHFFHGGLLQLFQEATDHVANVTNTCQQYNKADNLIRTVPPKCPHKELFAEFILLRLLEVCDIAKTTKKGQTDKGWAQCRFEMVPIKSSGESTQIYLNVLVEAAFHRLRVAKIADGTVLNMRYDGFRSSSSQVEKKCRIELEDVNKVILEVEKRRKMEANERLTKASPRSRRVRRARRACGRCCSAGATRWTTPRSPPWRAGAARSSSST